MEFLPNNVVSVNVVNCFKSNSSKFWREQL